MELPAQVNHIKIHWSWQISRCLDVVETIWPAVETYAANTEDNNKQVNKWRLLQRDKRTQIKHVANSAIQTGAAATHAANNKTTQVQPARKDRHILPDGHRNSGH